LGKRKEEKGKWNGKGTNSDYLFSTAFLKLVSVSSEIRYEPVPYHLANNSLHRIFLFYKYPAPLVPNSGFQFMKVNGTDYFSFSHFLFPLSFFLMTFS